MNDSNAKQQIAEKVKNSSNIMVTVSTNPSVDELSAALGLTLLLNKMSKHATAVFSGQIPPAITFLDPAKTFENTVDSLRDFIIALDKEKADHLRYKVDGDVVKIFITPYRTTITSDDLEFSQGDYNVELVLALGVKSRDDLDGALAAHGRILHDATVVSLSVGENESELGSINWREEKASSLGEMLVNLTESFKSDKGLIDEQIATAFLTGIVAATDRFSNNRTSSKVMTIAAQLMSAGANQQLIASKLEEAHEIGGAKATTQSANEHSDGTTDLAEGQSTKLSRGDKAKANEAQKETEDGSLTIAHGQTAAPAEEPEAEQAEVAKTAEAALAKQIHPEISTENAEQALQNQLKGVAPAVTTPSVADLQKDLAAASAEVDEAAEQTPSSQIGPAENNQVMQVSEQVPALGGTLNATTEQAEQDKRRELDDERNRTILTHGSGNNYVGDSSPVFQSPLNAASQPEPEQPIVDPFHDGVPEPSFNATPSVVLPPISPLSQPVEPSKPQETLADLDRQNRTPHEEARAAVDAAFGAVPFNPAGNPTESVGAQPLGEVPHDTNIPAPTLPPMPPMPDFSTLPPLPQAPAESAASDLSGSTLPPENLEDVLGAPQTPVQAPVPAPSPNDPRQFKIPGQG